MKKILLLIIGLVLIGIFATGVVAISGLLNGVVTVGNPDPGLPDSMAAMGDSITQAVNLGFFWFGENPGYSWSTGYAFDPVWSHYERIHSRNPEMTRGNVFNNAVNGARVHDLLENQLPKTLAQKPEYVTILIGSNDACHGTPLEEFESDYRHVVQQLADQLPGTKILLMSTPDIAKLKEIVGDSSYCRWIWKTFDVCPELLGEGADVKGFKQGVIEMDNAIRGIADDFDDNNVKFVSIYEYEFKPYQVSDLDCFHPSTWGQAELAKITWENGFY